MNTIIAIIIGIILGFLAEWVVDWLYGRRKVHALEGELNELRKQKTIADSQLIALREENEHLKEIYSAPVAEIQEPPLDETVTQKGADQVVGLPAFIEEEGEEQETEAQQIDAEFREETEMEVDEPEAVPEEQVESQPDIEQITGISPAYAQKLQDIGINTPQELLERGSSASGRAEIADKTGISQSMLLDWVNHSELYRIDGIRPEDVEALKALGITTVVKLATQDPMQLHTKLVEALSKEEQSSQPPSAEQVQGWIEQANKLPNVVAYMAVRSKLGGK